MKRREFITLLGGAATWPVAARAQQGERVRRVGVLMSRAAGDPESPVLIATLLQALAEAGWTEDHNLRIDYRFGGGDADSIRRSAAELAALAPDVILGHGATIAAALQQATSSVPIVFVQVSDPVGEGMVASLARPGGNTTGFGMFEYSISVKWLELLKQMAPTVTRVAVFRDRLPSGVGHLGAIQGAAPLFGVELTNVEPRDAGEIERAMVAFALGLNGGLIVTPTARSTLHRDLIIALAARHRLPAVYPNRIFTAGGGLISYGNDTIDAYRRAASYLDRILKGEKAADLPVVRPTKLELVINLKAAKALGLEIPPTLLARADEVIE
jgi:putative tryptophan/tyrosine transport system substrate-binding protein